MPKQQVQLSKGGSHLQGLCSCRNDETGEECDNVDMIENDSCDDETSDEQDDDSE